MSQVTLPITLVNKILTHAQHSPESEVCGLIAARDGKPDSVYPIANVAETPEKLMGVLWDFRLALQDVFGTAVLDTDGKQRVVRKDVSLSFTVNPLGYGDPTFLRKTGLIRHLVGGSQVV